MLSDVHLYGEMHRFLPALCRWRGARISELVVNHRARVAGQTKYGLKRILKVLFDLLTVKFLGDYLTKPIYFFGKLAMLTLLISFLSVGVAILQKFGYLTAQGVPVRLNSNIFILFAIMTFITTGMLMMAGLLAELLIRIYHESQGRTPYKIRQSCGLRITKLDMRISSVLSRHGRKSYRETRARKRQLADHVGDDDALYTAIPRWE